MPSLRRPLHRRKGLLFHRLTPPIPIAGLNYFEALADPPSTPSRAGIALPVLATPSSSKRKRNSVESRTKRKKKFRPSRLDLRPVDAGQTEEADSPTNLDGTDGISQLSPSSPASVVDESLLLASQGTAGEFSQTLHESLLNSPLAGNSPETSTQAGGLVTAPTMAVSPPLLTEDTNRAGSSAGPEEELRIMVLPSRDVCPTPVALYYLVGVSSSPGDGVGAVSRQMITHSLCPNLFQ